MSAHDWLTVVVDLPSVRLVNGTTTAPTPGQTSAWKWAGWTAVAPPGLGCVIVIVTVVVLPEGVIVTEPACVASRPGPKVRVSGVCADATAVLARSTPAAMRTESLRTIAYSFSLGFR